MNRQILCFLISFTCVGTAVAQQTPAPAEQAPQSAPIRAPDTLMFTIDELNDIQARIAAGIGDENARSDSEGSAIERASLYVSTILFSGPQDWTVWVNGVPIRPGQNLQTLEVTDIGANFVELRVPLSARGMSPIRLAPNQTFVVRTGLVVEGQM